MGPKPTANLECVADSFATFGYTNAGVIRDHAR